MSVLVNAKPEESLAEFPKLDVDMFVDIWHINIEMGFYLPLEGIVVWCDCRKHLENP